MLHFNCIKSCSSIKWWDHQNPITQIGMDELGGGRIRLQGGGNKGCAKYSVVSASQRKLDNIARGELCSFKMCLTP